MKLLGYEVSIRKHGSPILDNRGSWWPRIHEPFTGAWQRNIEWTTDTILAHQAVYACITLIASDIGKLRPKLVQQDDDGIWTEIDSSAFSPVLRKPNNYQTRIQFIEWWFFSKLIRGNTYALKERDNRGVVRALYLLDPNRVKVLVAPDGAIFYELSQDNLSGLTENITVPADEIIHDRMNCLFHPLVGTSPLFAAGQAANVGLKIASGSANFFAQGSNPSGVLTAPGSISQEDADRVAADWNVKFSGDNAGRIAVVGDGLKYEPMRMTAVDAQLIAQLKWTAQVVCSVFHVPAFKAGAGEMPTYQNAEVLNGIYYSDCLQSHIESFELVLDEGLGLTEVPGKTLGVEMDLDGLLRMDQATQIKALSDGVGGAIFTPNEARRKLDLQPLEGGDTVYMQHQDYSIEALAKRDRREDPFAQGVAPDQRPDPGIPAAPGEEDEKHTGVLFWKNAELEYEKKAA